MGFSQMKRILYTVMALAILLSLNCLLLPSSAETNSTDAAEATPNSHDKFWDKCKNVPLGPLFFDFGGQTRLRYEYYHNFLLTGYVPEKSDQLFLTRIRLDFTFRYEKNMRISLQFQDTHSFLTQFEDSDFPTSNPIENTLDICQLYLEWLNIGRSQIGSRLGG